MAFWNVLAVGAAGIVLNKLRKDMKEQSEERRREFEENERRKSMTCVFSDSLEYDVFTELVFEECKQIKRVKDVYVRGPFIYGLVMSNSGLTKSKFTIDFNDYGNVTGKYWIEQENEETTVPTVLANNISNALLEFYAVNRKEGYTGNSNDEPEDKYEYGYNYGMK